MLAKQSAPFSEDPFTDLFCRDYLQNHVTLQKLQEKVQVELGISPWQPLGKLLIIVSENDILGNLLALFSGYLTGNRMIIKARVSTNLLQSVKDKLALTDDELTLMDWKGGAQDDEALLKDLDGLLLAGSLPLIQHFRKITPHPIRLIEFGPKLSAIAICGEITDPQSVFIEKIIQDVTLFSQRVCSAPRFILVESNNLANKLMADIDQRLATMSPLDDETKLVQSYRYQELLLLSRVTQSDTAVAYSDQSGWGATLSHEINPKLWFTHGFHIIEGDVNQHLQTANKLWRRQLQTLGIAGHPPQNPQGFTRLCPIGKMHYRPLTAPHDGFFELSSLVNFISKESV